MAPSKKSQADRKAAPPPPEPLRVAVADSHTHLDMQDGTPEDGLAKAASVGVDTVVQVGCDLPGSRWAAELAARHPNVHATVSLHPNEAPRLVLGDPDGWSGQRRGPGGMRALDEAMAEIDALAGDTRSWVEPDQARSLDLVPAGTAFTVPPVLFAKITEEDLDGYRARFGGAVEAV